MFSTPKSHGNQEDEAQLSNSDRISLVPACFKSTVKITTKPTLEKIK